jgi:hypothetical protein
MKRYNLIVIAFVAVALGIFLLYRNHSSAFRKRDADFSIQADKTDRISIRSGNSEIILTKENDEWKVNEKPANRNRVDDLLVLAGRLDPVAPAPESDKQELSEKLDKGTEIYYYSGRKLLNAYRMCKWNRKLFASRYRSDKIFQTEVRGYPNVDLIQVFRSDPAYWSNSKLTGFRPEDIKRIRIRYPGNTDKDFDLKMTSDGSFQLTDNKQNDLSSVADKELIGLYLHFYTGLTARPVPKDEKQDSLSLKEPFFILLVESDKQEDIHLTGYRKYDSSDKTDMNGFYGILNKKELMLLNYRDFDPILLELKDFLKK